MSCLSCVTKRVDALELALAAQEVAEAHLGALAVEVAVEVEQVGLEQRVVGMLVERRATPEVDRARVHLAVGPLVPAGIHTSAGRHTWLGTSTLAVGTPSKRPRWSPRTTLPRTSYGRPSIDAARSTSPPASARRIAVLLTGSSTPSSRSTSSSGIDVEVEATPELAQQRDVALAIAAEVEVLADHDRRRRQAR